MTTGLEYAGTAGAARLFLPALARTFGAAMGVVLARAALPMILLRDLPSEVAR